MRTKVFWIILVLFATLYTVCFAADVAQKAGNEYICKRAASPVKIDGKLDEAAWAQAGKISPMYLLATSKPSTTQACR